MMPDLGSHSVAILSAYAVALTLLGLMVAYTLIGSGRAKAQLEKLRRNGDPSEN